MRIIVQRSLNSSVEVDNKIVGSIDKGLVLLVAFKTTDTVDNLDYLINKVLNLRIFDDENGIMNKSVLDIKGKILSISQFTLYADARKGNRPNYSNAMKSEEAKELYDEFNKRLGKNIEVEEGIFGADMKVNINNDGPVTIILESRDNND